MTHLTRKHRGAAVDEESSKLRQGLAALAVKPGAKNHLVVIGNDLDSQFDKATRLVPNQEYSPILLEHSGGFQRVVSLLTKENPDHVGELVIVIGDVEISPIRALPLTSRHEQTVADRKVEGLLGTIVAAVEIGLDLQNKPDVSIYVWDELKQGPDQVLAKLFDSLSDFFRNATHVKVLSPVPARRARKDRTRGENHPAALACQRFAIPTCRS